MWLSLGKNRGTTVSWMGIKLLKFHIHSLLKLKLTNLNKFQFYYIREIQILVFSHN